MTSSNEQLHQALQQSSRASRAAGRRAGEPLACWLRKICRMVRSFRVRMVSRPRTGVITTTVLATSSSTTQGWRLTAQALCAPSGQRSLQLQASSNTASLLRPRCSFATSILATRTPMVGPMPRPEASKVVLDADGNQLSKPVKRKVAVVVGYVGTAFHGWQESTDKDVRTVERELEESLWKAGTIADSNHGDLSKIGWGRCAARPQCDKRRGDCKRVASICFESSQLTRAVAS